jgi:membrane fusion protein (multidrug efflux system)
MSAVNAANAANTEARAASREEAPATPKRAARRKGRRAYMILGAVVLIGAGAYFGIGLATADQVSTDDAQLEADVVPLALKVGGPILALHVRDNQTVKKGDVLAEIDPRDYQIRVAQAEADLEAARAQAATEGPSAGSRPNTAQVASARAALARTDAELRKADADLKRAKALQAQNAITAVELENAQNATDKARAARDQAAAQLKYTEEQHGFAEAKVKSAQALLEQAKAQLDYTKLVAPRDGTLSKVAVQEGQIVQPGQTIAQLVSEEPFVVANFKETQIGRMREGQHAEIEVDAYPGRKLGGKVESLSAATGARFSLLPPDNASGNFVKVVQRVPVKILLEKPEGAPVALRAGLSADVTVHLK